LRRGKRILRCVCAAYTHPDQKDIDLFLSYDSSPVLKLPSALGAVYVIGLLGYCLYAVCNFAVSYDRTIR